MNENWNVNFQNPIKTKSACRKMHVCTYFVLGVGRSVVMPRVKVEEKWLGN
jgi:hypothetical protein